MIRAVRAAIVAIGSELLGTDRLDTNSLLLTAVLERFGVELRRKAVVGDDEREIVRLLNESFEAADLVLVSGGLGPTADDLTRQAAAAAVGRELYESAEVLADIAAKFASFEMRMPEVNRRQAMILDGAEILANARGTAPGQRLRHERGTLFLFPGVPHELRAMVEAALVPWLERHGPGAPVEVRVLKVACLAESAVEERLAPAYEEFGREAIAVLASGGEIQLRLSARGGAGGADALDRLERLVAGAMGDAVFGRAAEETLEQVVGALLRRAGATVATAESCTAGLVAERLTRVAGSSAYFLGGVVAYDDRLKTELLGVPAAMIRRHGAVSREVAEAMATGIRRRVASDLGVAVTGIAGPGGGSPDKPVGTVHVALAGRDLPRPVHRRLRLPGDRNRVRQLSSQWALDLLRRCLLESAAGDGPR